MANKDSFIHSDELLNYLRLSLMGVCRPTVAYRDEKLAYVSY